jgi:hypothetical protein
MTAVSEKFFRQKTKYFSALRVIVNPVFRFFVYRVPGLLLTIFAECSLHDSV